MTWRAQINDRGVVTRYKDVDSGEVISAKEYDRRQQMTAGGQFIAPSGLPQMTAGDGTPTMLSPNGTPAATGTPAGYAYPNGQQYAAQPQAQSQTTAGNGMSSTPTPAPMAMQAVAPAPTSPDPSGGQNPLIQPGAQMLNGSSTAPTGSPAQTAPQPSGMQGKNLRMEGIPKHLDTQSLGYKTHGFLDATSIAILLPTLVLLALIIAAAHKKRLFPWQTIRTFNPPSGLMSPREYERSFLCPPNLRRHGRLSKRNPNATFNDQDGIVIPFGFLARTHLPVTIPLGRLPNKNMFIVAPSGSGKTTLMRAVIKALLAKPCVIIALEAKANDPNLDERREGFKYTVLPEAQQAGFNTLYFNPLDIDSINWNPLDLDPITFSSSIVQDVNSLPPEEQHWAERDHGYIAGLATLLKWGAVRVAGEDENGVAADVQPLECNPRGLMRLVNNRRNIVESLRRLKSNPAVDAAELNELTQTLSSIIRTDTDWDKNIQGVRGRLRMFKNSNVLRVTEKSNIDLRAAMHTPTVLIFGAPASLGPDAESLASCFVYQLQQALHTRYGTVSVLPLFAFFDEYQTLNLDIAGRLSAIVRGANGGLTVILQNIGQIAGRAISSDPTAPGGSELKTIFSNSSIRVCLHNADESTAKFFSDEIGKHAIVVPGISDHYDSNGFGIFPISWNRIHSQQVVARVDADSIKRMEKHHALVYLSPAGDAEFGEAKPFMCDLRGIEEIARLHLLHNVSGRNIPPGTPPGLGPNGDGNGGPGQPTPLGPVTGAPPAIPMPVAGSDQQAAMNGSRQCPHCGQAPGKGRFCIECGRPIPGSNGNGQDSVGAAGNIAPVPAREAVSLPAGVAQQVAIVPGPLGLPAMPVPSSSIPSFATIGAASMATAMAMNSANSQTQPGQELQQWQPAPETQAAQQWQQSHGPSVPDNPVTANSIGGTFGRYSQAEAQTTHAGIFGSPSDLAGQPGAVPEPVAAPVPTATVASPAGVAQAVTSRAPQMPASMGQPSATPPSRPAALQPNVQPAASAATLPSMTAPRSTPPAPLQAATPQVAPAPAAPKPVAQLAAPVPAAPKPVAQPAAAAPRAVAAQPTPAPAPVAVTPPPAVTAPVANPWMNTDAEPAPAKPAGSLNKILGSAGSHIPTREAPRQPLTSLVPDPSRMPVPQAVVAPTQAHKGGSSIEF